MLKRYYNNSKHKFVLIKCKKGCHHAMGHPFILSIIYEHSYFLKMRLLRRFILDFNVGVSSCP